VRSRVVFTGAWFSQELRSDPIPREVGKFDPAGSTALAFPALAERGFSTEARNCLIAYDWPGNVRELENTIERAIVLGTTEWILPEDLPEGVLETKLTDGSMTTYHAAVVQNKQQIIMRALEEAKQNHIEAARLLGIHPNYLQRLIRNLNLKTQF